MIQEVRMHVQRFGFTLAFCALVAMAVTAHAQQDVDSAAVREQLMTIERESHQLWFKRDLAALDALMSEDFTFVVMNGAVETKADVVARDRTAAPARRGRLEVQSLELQPERVTLRGNSAIVIGLLHIKATIAGRALPDTMRVLSVFTRENDDANWRLTARSITPILAPPRAPQ
jgi:ketosteroid isomerase-like protein